MTPRLAVIVTTRNNANVLDECLRSVREQTIRALELIVVDNFSTDATPRIARSYADCLLQAGPERSRQRNVGAAASAAGAFFFLDSDMIMASVNAEECLDVASRGFGAVIVPESSKGTGYWAACKALERSCYLGDDTIEAARYIHREIFEQLGGFDEDITGEEDWDLTARIRARGELIGRTRTPLLHDEGRLSLRETIKTKFYYGRTMRRYIAKHPGVARRQIQLVRPAFVRNWGRLARRPMLTAGIAIMKSAEFAAGAVGLVLGPRPSRMRS